MEYINKVQTADPNEETILVEGEKKYVCCICGRICDYKIKAYGRSYCCKHYKQCKAYGHPLENNPRTTFDRNEIRVEGDKAYIDLYNTNCEVVGTAIIDVEDVPLVRDIKWKLSSSGYAMHTPKNKGGNVHMSRIVLGVLGEDGFVDHINHNTLDNRKANLRLVTKSQNAMNHEAKGVRKTNDGRYYAYIKKNQRMLNLGLYVYCNEAEYARWYAEQQIFGEYAYPREKPEIAASRASEIQAYIDRKIHSKCCVCSK